MSSMVKRNMLMFVLSPVFAIFFLQHAGLAFELTSKLEIIEACNLMYGVILQEVGKIRSVITCSVVCAENPRCVSFVFDGLTSSCGLNSEPVPEALTTSCSNQVIYGKPTQNRWRSPSLGSCRSHADCTVANTECVGSMCHCRNGYSLDKTSRSCKTECTSYGDTFQVYSDMVISRENTAVYDGFTSLQSCWYNCSKTSNFVCRTGEFTSAGVCRISMLHVLADGATTLEQIGTTFFHRNCN